VTSGRQPPRGYVAADGGLPGRIAGLMASAQSIGGSLTVLHQSGIGVGPPRHVHAREDECIFVLDGALTVECGSETWRAEPGSFAFLPRGVPHTFSADGDPAEVLLIAVPAGIEHYFAEINQAGDVAAQERIGEKYAIRVA
jgi:mannose-6-phosphate isomerase-like protein (cupin superfamily)